MSFVTVDTEDGGVTVLQCDDCGMLDPDVDPLHEEFCRSKALNTGIDPKQLRTYVIWPALQRLHPHIPFSYAATQLVLGTALTESKLQYLDQIDPAAKPGPAFGLWQMEKLTFEDHLKRMGPKLEPGVFGYMSRIPEVSDLHWNLLLGAAMCRVHYWHAPEMIPLEGDAEGMAKLWKKRYNTHLGAGTIEKALPWFKLACSF